MKPTDEMVEAAEAVAFSETLNFYISDSENGICRVPRQKMVEVQQALRALEAALSRRPAEGIKPTDAAAMWQELLEKDDRTSPAEYPDHALITFEELQEFLSRRPEGVKAAGDFDPLAEARALTERAGIDMLEEQDLFIADLTETLQRALSSLETEQGENATEPWAAAILDASKRMQAGLDPFASQPSDREGWRDISTAPKDGTVVDLLTKEGVRVTDVRWVVEPRDGTHASPRLIMDGWKDRDQGPWGCLTAEQFTHWMPLPTPTATTMGEAE
jgi:hypothetical protein